MRKESLELKIYKMGPKLGLFFSNLAMKKFKVKIGDNIKINILAAEKEHAFLSKLNELVTVRKDVIKN
jgi:hypothetical protein